MTARDNPDEPTDLTVSELIARAENALHIAYTATWTDGTVVDLSGRGIMASVGGAYAHLAQVAQAERDFEERRMREIRAIGMEDDVGSRS